MKNLLKSSIYVVALITLLTPDYSHAAIQNINTATVVKKILSTDDSLASIRATASGKRILSTQLTLKSAMDSASSVVTIRQSYDVKINATYLEITTANSQFKMIQRTVKGKIERYVFITKSFAENTLKKTGSAAYIPYSDKWVLLDDTKITIEKVLTDVIKESVPFTIAQLDYASLITNTATKDKSGKITLDLSAATSTVVVPIGTIKYSPLAQQDSFTLTHKATLNNIAFDSNMAYTRSTQKGVSFTVPKIFSYASQTEIDKEIELDAKGTVYGLSQSGLVIGTKLPVGFSLCSTDLVVDLSIYCIANNELQKSVINIFAWSSGGTKDDISMIKNDADARRIIQAWFIPGDGRVYANAYTKTINGAFFVLKEEKSYYNNKLTHYFTAYTIKDGKIFKIELATKDLKDSSIAAQRANLIFFLENSFQKNTTAQVPVVVSNKVQTLDDLAMTSLVRIKKAGMMDVGAFTVEETTPPYVVPIGPGFTFHNQIVHNGSVFLKSNSGGKEIQIQINAGGKLGLNPDVTLHMQSANGSDLEQKYKGLFPGSNSTNFNITRKNGYVFATFDTYDPRSFAGIYTYIRHMYITRDGVNLSDPYFSVSFASNKPLEERLTTEFVEGFTF